MHLRVRLWGTTPDVQVRGGAGLGVLSHAVVSWICLMHCHISGIFASFVFWGCIYFKRRWRCPKLQTLPRDGGFTTLFLHGTHTWLSFEVWPELSRLWLIFLYHSQVWGTGGLEQDFASKVTREQLSSVFRGMWTCYSAHHRQAPWREVHPRGRRAMTHKEAVASMLSWEGIL